MDLIDIKSLNEENDKRWEKIYKKFKSLYSTECSICVRAPGRVNLIGEHIDYSGYSVVPIATSQDILIGISSNDEKLLHIDNIDPQYEHFSCNMETIKIDSTGNTKWYEYILCGIKGILNEYDVDIKGIFMVVNGSIPAGCGLSSSSALVCASAIATAFVHGLNIASSKLAEICAHAERFIGTEGGGMDQAASFLSREGFASHIEFNPLRVTPVELPSDCAFVVSNSLVVKNKAASSDFNHRVMECRLATFVLAKKLGLDWKKFSKLGDLHKFLGKNCDFMLKLVEENLHKDSYQQAEVAQVLKISLAELHKQFSKNVISIQRFKLYQRSKHVFEEAKRVYQFNEICCSGKSSLSELGRLMTDSHKSTQYLYECSHPALDEMVKLSNDIAYGARLTGAGWGGCIVALVDKKNVANYIDFMKKNYFNVHGLSTDNNMFSSLPGNGACIFAIPE